MLKVYPNKMNEGRILENYKENIKQIKILVTHYSIAEYRKIDKLAIKKVDPVVCYIFEKFAKEYNYNAESLIYNYAMSFSEYDGFEIDVVPQIKYNLFFIEKIRMSKNELNALLKICRNARKNDKIETIGYTSKFNKLITGIKKTFNLSKTNALPEGKY